MRSVPPIPAISPDLKKQILSNGFVDGVRIRMVFDEQEFKDLCRDLKALAVELRGSKTIDRELMLELYGIPLIIRNMFLSFTGHGSRPEIVDRLEDAWVELDALVLDCLVDG